MTADATCTPCGDNTYKTGTNALATCIAQATCNAGQKISADSKTALRTCSDCGADTYQGATGDRSTTCSAQSTCGAGEKISADSKTALRICSNCDAGTYQSATDHRTMACTAQATCNAGQKISADSKTALRTCSNCDAGTYQSAMLAHRVTSCIAQTQWSGSDLAAHVSSASDGDEIWLGTATYVWGSEVTCSTSKTITITGTGIGNTVLNAESSRWFLMLKTGCTVKLRNLSLKNGCVCMRFEANVIPPSLCPLTMPPVPNCLAPTTGNMSLTL